MKTILLTLLLTALAVQLFSQEYVLDKEKSELSISGTSTLHDWESTVETFDVQAKFETTTIKNIKFYATVKSIKSGKYGMDKNIYKAMKAEDYPKIQFETDLAIKGNKTSGKGKLTIAGKSKEIPIELLVKNEETKVVQGSINLKMTDFGITPPIAVFGTIKTGDDIIIKINFALNKQKKLTNK